jgi:hypothetical protein
MTDDGHIGVFAAGGEVFALGYGEDVEEWREDTLMEGEERGGDALAARTAGGVAHGCAGGAGRFAGLGAGVAASRSGVAALRSGCAALRSHAA